MSLFNELKRRNVIRVAMAYVVAAWLIIQVVETILPAFGYSDVAIRYIVIVLAIAFIPSLVFSWVFEITPEGLKREVDVVSEHSITRFTAKKLDRIIMVVLALALGYFAFDKFILSESREASIARTAHEQGRSAAFVESYGDKAIAVLPFENLSGDIEQEYFSDGIAEELLNLLTRVRELRVIARSSSFAFKGQGLDVSDIAARLNVAHVLTGSVRQSGPQVRVTAQLIEARSGTQVWSKNYDGQMDDIFAVQDDVALAVVKELKVEMLGPEPKVPRTTPEVHAMTLQARQIMKHDTRESYLKVIALLERALAIDPDYPPAWAALSLAYAHGSKLLMPESEALIKRKEVAKQLLRTDPGHFFAYAMLGEIARSEGDLKTAGQHYSKALSLAPNNDSNLNNAAVHMAWLGRFKSAAEIFKVLTDRHPTNLTYFSNLGVVNILDGQFEEAQSVTEIALALRPGSFFATWNRLFLLIFHTQEYETALETCERLSTKNESEPMKFFCRAIIYPKLGFREKGNAALASLEQGFHKGDRSNIGFLPYAYAIARAYAVNNRSDSAFKWLETSYQTSGTFGLTIAWNDWLLGSLHADNRWQPFLQKAGVSEEQLRPYGIEILLPE